MLSGKPELRHHQQSFLPQTSLVLSATGSLELRLISSAILEHTNSNTSGIWLRFVIVSNDRRTIVCFDLIWLHNLVLFQRNKFQGYNKTKTAQISTFKCRPRWLSWMRRPIGDQEVAGSTPSEVGNILSLRLIMKYFLRSFTPFRWF